MAAASNRCVPSPVLRRFQLRRRNPHALKNSIGMEFVIVPKGKSWQGSWATVKVSCYFQNAFFHIHIDGLNSGITFQTDDNKIRSIQLFPTGSNH